MITLETPRLLLRPISFEDLSALHKITGDPEIMRYWTTGPDRSIAETRGRLLVNQIHLKEHGFGDWAVVVKEGNCFIGFIGLQYQSISGQDHIGVGYALDKTYWNQGYGTEAGRRVTDYALSNLQLEEVVATVDKANARSRKLLEKCGFSYSHDGIFDGFPRLIYRIGQLPGVTK